MESAQNFPNFNHFSQLFFMPVFTGMSIGSDQLI